jgi:hypothetical protein
MENSEVAVENNMTVLPNIKNGCRRAQWLSTFLAYARP